MTSRREFVQIGLTGVALLPLVPFDASLFASAAYGPFYKVIFDERFPQSVAFARALAGRWSPMHGIPGDVTALWYDDLYHQWKSGARRIAGMTTKESLFCLEILARDAGLRVTHRQDHADGLVSWSIGPRPAQRG
jgi:hypothetical protein